MTNIRYAQRGVITSRILHLLESNFRKLGPGQFGPCICIRYRLPTIGEYMFVEFIYWHCHKVWYNAEVPSRVDFQSVRSETFSPRPPQILRLLQILRPSPILRLPLTHQKQRTLIEIYSLRSAVQFYMEMTNNMLLWLFFSLLPNVPLIFSDADKSRL